MKLIILLLAALVGLTLLLFWLVPEYGVTEIDGHKYITSNHSSRVPPTHHPDCPCGKAR